MHKPIIQAITNNMGVILVIRSPHSRKWLFNICISTQVENHLIALKGRTMKTLILSCLLFCAFLLSACGQNPVAPEAETTTKYHYTYISDTLYQSDFDNDDTLQAYHDSVWTSATLYAYQDSVKWSLASLTFDKPATGSAKPTWWNGKTISIIRERLPLYWTTIVIRYSRKEEVN